MACKNRPPPSPYPQLQINRCGTFASEPYHTLIRKYLEKNGLASADVPRTAQR